ncbi:MAG: toxin-antitoxin system protein [Actinomycetota bacterium]|nr:toxin-antitoxin system protein [Actinomycetota bacterium]
MTTEPTTTIKVPKGLRERISTEATQSGLTAAGLISALLDERERQARYAAVRKAYAAVDAEYTSETAAWDSLAGDGISS